MNHPVYTEHEEGERAALLQVRSFITQHGTKEVDAFCAQRLHDMMMDARHRNRKLADVVAATAGSLQIGPGGLRFGATEE